mgnify:CR=1 FL=1
MSNIENVDCIGDNLYLVQMRLFPDENPEDGFLLKYTMNGKEVRGLANMYQERNPEMAAHIMSFFDEVEYDDEEYQLKVVDATGFEFDEDDDENEEDVGRNDESDDE